MKKLHILLLVVISLTVSCTTTSEQILLEDLIGKYKTRFTEAPLKIPVPYSVDAPMLGNGYTGVAIAGLPEKQVYYLARNDFWRLKSSFNESFPAVLGKLEIDIPGLKDASYLIEQDIFSAITYSEFSGKQQDVQFTSYVSACEDVMVLEIQMSGDGKLEGSVSLKLPGETELVDNPPLDLVFPAETESGRTDEGVYYISRAFEKDVDIPSRAVCALKVLDSESNRFSLSKNGKITIALAFSSSFKSDNCLQSAINRLAGLNRTAIETMEARHKAWWKDYWSESYVDIRDPIIEKQYYLSNYSLASFSRDKDFPPSIFGTCITRERPHWNGDYHLNYNHLAPYYGLFSSNHIEQAIPCNMAILAQQERGEYYSKKVCGIEGGIMLPVGAGPLGIETTRRNEMMEKHRAGWIESGNVEDEGLFWAQKSNSAYAMVNMAMHFYSSYDPEYTAMYYPYVKGVAGFWENYLSFENDSYVIYDDAIHEGTVGTVNPILSLGLVRLVMQTAMDMSHELNMDPDRADKWQHILDHLSDYSYQERDGKQVFRYSSKGTDWWGDNTLGIQHIFPGGQIGPDSDQELLQVARNTIDVMQRWIDPNGSNSFFPAAVRVGYNPDTILAKLRKYCEHTYPNGFQYNNPHGIENCSTVPNTINEMLCMGHGGVLRVFPVWPRNKDASFYQLRTHGAFLVSAELKNQEVQFIEVLSERGRVLHLQNPWDDETVSVIRPDGSKECYQGNRFQINTSSGEKIRITR